MRHAAIAIDYDGTLAHLGEVNARTQQALERARASARKLILVTGRELDELLPIFPGIGVFDRVVAENGALMYDPATRERRPLALAPPESLTAELARRGVSPISVGRSIVATVEPHERVAIEVIRELGLELHVVFNKGAVMILPTSVNKASGLAHALAELGVSARNVVAVGDGENDHSMLELAEYAAAVANAVPALKKGADWVLSAEAGLGVIELIDALLSDDLRSREANAARRRVLLGADADGNEFRIAGQGMNLLVLGAADSARSLLVASILARAAALGYQYCIVDPQDRFASLGAGLALGDTRQEPNPKDVLAALENPQEQVIANLAGLLAGARPAFLQTSLVFMHELLARSGRPHWLVVDDADLLPIEGASFDAVAQSTLLTAVDPGRLDPKVLAVVDLVIAAGPDAGAALARFRAAAGIDATDTDPRLQTGPDEVLVWRPRGDAPAMRIRLSTEAAAKADAVNTAAPAIAATAPAPGSRGTH